MAFNLYDLDKRLPTQLVSMSGFLGAAGCGAAILKLPK
jgi:hypothetical protein